MIRKLIRKHHRAVKAKRHLRPLLVSTLRQRRKVYAPSSSKPLAGRSEALVASYNIHKCVGLDGRFDPERTGEVIKEIGADVIALQEVDERFGNRTGLLDLHALEQESGLVPVPLKGVSGSHGWHGNLVLVRNGAVTDMHKIALPGAEPRGAVMVDLSLPGGRLRVIAAHLGLLRRSRARQIETILSAGDPKDGRPVIFMGDLNEWRLGKRSTLTPLGPTFGPLQSTVASFPSRFPVWSLDRILARPHDAVSRIEVHDTPLARIASDHLPIKAYVDVGHTNRHVHEERELALRGKEETASRKGNDCLVSTQLSAGGSERSIACLDETGGQPREPGTDLSRSSVG